MLSELFKQNFLGVCHTQSTVACCDHTGVVDAREMTPKSFKKEKKEYS